MPDQEWIYRFTNSGKMIPIEKLVRCRECRHKGNPYECRLDRDLEEHGSHRTHEWNDWFCADGMPKESEQE